MGFFDGLINPPVDKPGVYNAPPLSAHVIIGRVHRVGDVSRMPEVDALFEDPPKPAAPPAPPQPKPSPREKRMAAVGITYLPLEPGQKRRRRAGPLGKPTPYTPRNPVRKKPGPPSRADKQAERLAAVTEYKGPVRAPGEMTYGQAARILADEKAGRDVDIADVGKAYDVVMAALRGDDKNGPL